MCAQVVGRNELECILSIVKPESKLRLPGMFSTAFVVFNTLLRPKQDIKLKLKAEYVHVQEKKKKVSRTELFLWLNSASVLGAYEGTTSDNAL